MLNIDAIFVFVLSVLLGGIRQLDAIRCFFSSSKDKNPVRFILAENDSVGSISVWIIKSSDLKSQQFSCLARFPSVSLD